MKKIDEMTLDEMRNEIKGYVDQLDKEQGYAFVSYSHMDCEFVYRKVLEWMRAGYNIYLDVDFENKSSDENWITIMEQYVQNINCKVAICFRSAHYYCSYAALLELLTIRGKKAKQNRQEPLKVEIFQCDKIAYNEMLKSEVDNGTVKISMKEVYAEKHKKYVKDMQTAFLSHNTGEKGALEKGIKYFYEGNKGNDFFEQKEFESAEEIIEWINDGFKSGPTQYFENMGQIITQWFIVHGLTGNYKEDITGEQLKKYGIDRYIKSDSAKDIPSPDKTEENIEEITEGNIVEEKVEERTEEKNTEENTEPEKADENIEEKLAEEKVETATAKKKKKVTTTTGDITYTLYGETHTENQSDMMLRFFAQVLKRHLEYVATIHEYSDMTCVSQIDYTKKENQKDMLSCFRTCHNFTYSNGQSVCIGTGLNIETKLKKMAALLQIVGEDKGVFYSEQVELPETKVDGRKTSGKRENGGTKVKFTVYGVEYESNQSDMLGTIFSKLIEKHPDRLEEIVDQIYCVSLVDYSNVEREKRPSCFNSMNKYSLNGTSYVVGGGLSMKDKVRMVGKLLSICGESLECVQIENEEIEFVTKKSRKSEKSFL